MADKKKKYGAPGKVVKILLCFRISAHFKVFNFSSVQFKEILSQLYANNIDKMESLYF